MTARCGMPTVAARRDVSVCSRGQRCQTARKKLARCCKRQGAKGHGSSRARGIALDLSCSAQGLRNATKPRRELRSGSTASKLPVPARQSRQHGAANSSSSNTPGTSKPVSGQRRVATGRVVACLEQEWGSWIGVHAGAALCPSAGAPHRASRAGDKERPDRATGRTIPDSTAK